MGSFARFVLAYPVAVPVAAVAFLIGAYGTMSDAYSLYTLGLQAWVWQLAALALFFVTIVGMLFKLHQKSEAWVNQEAAAPAVDPKEARVRRINALNTMDYATEAASSAISAKGGRELELAMPMIEAALLTARREFGVDIPPKSDDAALTAFHAAEFMRTIRPFAREGHDEDAKRVAREYIASIPNHPLS